MARSRSGGGAYAVALVVMGCLFVVTLLFAIIFYTKIEEADAAREAAVQRQTTYITPSETARADAMNVENGSVFSYQAERIDSLTNQVTALTSQRADADLSATQANEQVEIRQERIAELEADIEQLEADAKAALEGYEAEVARLESARDNLQQQLTQVNTQATATITNSGDAGRRQIEELNTQLAEAQALQSELNAQIATREKRIEELERYLKANVLETRVTTADGEISSVFANGRQMFINRGRNQGVMLGMTFEVYEPGTVISLEDGTNQLRGKATIEVFEMDDDSATCRVVRQARNTNLDPGDMIANIVYDPNKTYIFYVFGNYDIEGDGGPNDIDRVRNMITQWNAKVADLQVDEEGLPILVPEVDYLVLGQQPEFPPDLDPTIIDQVAIREQQEKRQAYDTYQKLVDEAKRLRIPILNQNRFLDLVGYYQR